jgi:hypothetical protein
MSKFAVDFSAPESIVAKCHRFVDTYQSCFHPKLSAAKELHAFQQRYHREKILPLDDEIFTKLRAELYGRDEKLRKKDDEFQAILAQETANLNRISQRLAMKPFNISDVPLVAPTSDSALSLYALMRQMIQILDSALTEVRRS